MNDQKVSIPVDLFNALANYLSERPFREVAGFMSAMGQIQQQIQDGAVRDVPPPPKAN